MNDTVGGAEQDRVSQKIERSLPAPLEAGKEMDTNASKSLSKSSSNKSLNKKKKKTKKSHDAASDTVTSRPQSSRGTRRDKSEPENRETVASEELSSSLQCSSSPRLRTRKESDVSSSAAETSKFPEIEERSPSAQLEKRGKMKRSSRRLLRKVSSSDDRDFEEHPKTSDSEPATADRLHREDSKRKSKRRGQVPLRRNTSARMLVQATAETIRNEGLCGSDHVNLEQMRRSSLDCLYSRSVQGEEIQRRSSTGMENFGQQLLDQGLDEKGLRKLKRANSGRLDSFLSSTKNSSCNNVAFPLDLLGSLTVTTSSGNDLFRVLNVNPWTRRFDRAWEQEVLDAVRSNPEACRQKQKFNCFSSTIYPLAMMCALGLPLRVVKACHAAYPPALFDQDEYVGTVLHYACSYQGTVPVIEWLIEEDRSMIEVTNNADRTPFHVACMYSSRREVVKLLLEEGCGKFLGALDKHGNTPLHLALDYKACVEVVELLSKNLPSVTTVQSQEKQLTPLHVALERHASFGSVKALLKADALENTKKQQQQHQGALQMTDSKGRLPIHVAAESHTDARVLKLLVNSFPTGLRHRCGPEDEIPLQVAHRVGITDEETLTLLHPQHHVL